jgi:flagellum-specific ATP synthase
MSVLSPHLQALERLQCPAVIGTVASVRGLSVLVDEFRLPIGSLVRIHRREESGSPRNNPAGITRGEVVGFDGSRSIVMLLTAAGPGISPGDVVISDATSGGAQTVMVGQSLLGRVINGLGEPIDNGPAVIDAAPRPLRLPPTSALSRRRILEPLPTGVRAIDAMVTLGKGQRVGVFSGPGVGKSTLVGTIARNTAADVNVIGLIGERGREVRDFIEQMLGHDGLRRSVVVVATSDQSPLLRVRAALVACSVAEFFCQAGKDVLLMMDSITRFAQAQRQIGLTVGEQPATRGYTPSVFAELASLCERAGAIEGAGSITGLYAVLVEGDDLNEPVSDAARGILDGHITLSRKLAASAFHPAINLLDSISRVADDVCDQHHIAARRIILKLLASYAQAEELINIGAYARGSNPTCDAAIALKPAIDRFLQQQTHEAAHFPQTCRSLLELAAAAQQELALRQAASLREHSTPGAIGYNSSGKTQVPAAAKVQAAAAPMKSGAP